MPNKWTADSLPGGLIETILGTMGEGVVVQASTGEIVANNRAAEEILGLTADQLRGTTSMDETWHAIKANGDPFPPEEHPGMVTLATGVSVDNVLMGVSRPDGSYRWLKVASRPAYVDGERFSIATFSDVTELRHADMETERLEHETRQLMASLPVVAFLADMHGVVVPLLDRGFSSKDDVKGWLLDNPAEFDALIASAEVLWANEQAGRLFDVPVSDLFGPFLPETITDEWKVGFAEEVSQLWEKGSCDPVPSTMVIPHGPPRTGMIQAIALGEGRERFRKVLVTFTDTTEQDNLSEEVALELAVNEALLRSESEECLVHQACGILSGIAGHPLVWVGELAPDGIIVPIASHGLEMNDLAQALALGDDERRRIGPGERALASGEAVVIDHCLDDPWFEPYLPAIEALGAPTLGAFPSCRGAFEGVLNVHSQRLFTPTEEAALQRLAENLAFGIETFRKARSLEEAQERLRAEAESRDVFMASVAHELRTPLATIYGITSEVDDKWSSFSEEELRELSALVRQQSGDMAALIEDFLVVARSSRSMELQSEDVDLPAEAATVALGFSESILMEGRGSVVKGDSLRVRQILRNLIANAFRHGDPPVVVNFPTKGVVEVIDHGPGIARELEERVFEPYSGTADRARVPTSIGLGLTISRRLATAMGGELTYDRQRERTVFRLRLPTA